MTVYAKIEDSKLITAYNGYNGITGLSDSVELCLANGFTPYTEEEVSGYFSGTHKIIDGILTDITNTDEYIMIQKKKAIQQEKEKRDKVIDAVTSSVILDQLQKEAGIITQSVYDARFTAKANMYQNAINDFYTKTGLTAPTNIEV